MESDMMSVRVTCRGIKPMLMNRMSDETLLGIWTKAKAAKNAPRPSPREAADQKVHLFKASDGTSGPCVPTQALFACLAEAGRYVRLDGKKQVSTATSTMLPAFLTIEDLYMPLVKPGTKDPATWEVDIQRGRNPNGGEAVCICRPRFDRWEFTVNVLIDKAEISEDVIRGLFDIAGRRVGLFDFRPAKKGPYGMFVVERWDASRNEP